jgi:hypothetical protein
VRQQLVVSHAVKIASVEQGNSGVKGGMDGGILLTSSMGLQAPDTPIQPG